MQIFITYLRDYTKSLNIPTFLLTTGLTAFQIIANYDFGVESRIYSMERMLSLVSLISLYLGILGLNYFFLSVGKSFKSPKHPRILITLLIFAAVIYGITQIHWHLPLSATMPTNWKKYWQIVLVTLLKLIFVAISLRIMWRFIKPESLISKHFTAASYFKVVIFFIPAITLISFQHDFLFVYPGLKVSCL
jgi:hypothetical protein